MASQSFLSVLGGPSSSPPSFDSLSSGSASFSKDEWVVLNVGGQRFETYLSTLFNRDTMLARMFSDRNRCMLQRDAKGEYLIDRNGRAFEAILEYLRTGQLSLPAGVSKEQLLVECDFFSIDIPELTSKSLGPMHSNYLARSFRHARYWRIPAQREFLGVKDEILKLIHAEAEQGINYRIRFALLLANELTKCTGRLGDIVRQGKTITPHPSQLGGWCLILKQFFTRYFIDQLQYCFESLGFSTSLSMFRYCSCDWCSKKARKTRYLTISWDEPQADQELSDCLDRIHDLVQAGIHVFPMEVK